MEDVICPYCDCAQDINHDDGYGYREGVIHEQECVNCSKTFGFGTSISFYYEPVKLPCKNGQAHLWRPTTTVPRCFTRMSCKYCEEERQPTDQEKIENQIPNP